MKQKVVCVLGMHRSGTSMLTRIINLMGISLGNSEDIYQARTDNPEGFWEHGKIVSVHDGILSVLGSSWESTVPLPDKWWELLEVKEYKKELVKIINDQFIDIPIWAFKDPRTCIMMPLWKEIFDELNLEPVFIIPIRNPIDIASSIKKRDRIPLNQGIRLWYYYMINILEGTKNYNRLFINYDDIIENIEINLTKLTDFLKISVSEDIRTHIIGSVKPNLRHNRSHKNELKSIAGKQVYGLYELCMKLVENCKSTIDYTAYSMEVYSQYCELMNIRNVDKKSSLFITSLYVDDGFGYREESSLKHILYIEENGEFRVEFKLGSYGTGVKGLRWDPIEGCFCNCKIYDISVNNKNASINNSNASRHFDNEFDFFTDDPMFFINVDFEVIESVVVSGKICFFDYEKVGKELQCKLSESENNAQVLTNRVSESNDKVQMLNNELLKSNNIIQKLSHELDKEKDINNELVKKIDLLQLSYNGLLNEKMQLTNIISEITNSTSWKITAPLRKIKSNISSKK